MTTPKHAGGRPRIAAGGTVRKTITITVDDLLHLRLLDKVLSQAIRLLVKWHKEQQEKVKWLELDNRMWKETTAARGEYIEELESKVRKLEAQLAQFNTR